jgi:hypothetical protein
MAVRREQRWCRLARFMLLWPCLLCLGCGPRSPFDYVQVSGRITYDDGTPIPSGGIRLHFAAQDAPTVENAHPRRAIANVNDKGEFECVTSYKYCDGLIPGRHKVAVLEATDAAGKLLVPAAYTSISTTPLVVDTEEAPFDIKVPKPKTAR